MRLQTLITEMFDIYDRLRERDDGRSQATVLRHQPSSLHEQAKKIMAACRVMHGIMLTVERKKHSGFTEDDEKELATQMYKDLKTKNKKS